MKKTIMILAVVAIIAFLAMPFVTGTVAEKGIHQLVENINQRSSEYGATEIMSYERGYRSTSSSFKWTPPAIYKELIDGEIVYSCDGSHGVLGFSYTCKLDSLEGYTQFVAQQLEGKDPLSLSGSISVLGNNEQTLQLAAFETKDSESSNAVMSVKPAQLIISSNMELSKFDVDGEIEGFNLSFAGGEMSLGEIELNADIDISEHKMGIGESELTLENFTMQPKQGEEGENMSIDRLSFASEVQENGENLDVDYRMGADKFSFTSPESVTKKAVDLQDAVLEFSLHGLDAIKTNSIYEKFSDFYKNIDATEGEAGLAEMSPLLEILPDLEALLKAGLTLTTEISAKINQQKMEVGLELVAIDRLTMADFMAVMSNPASILDKMTANVKTVLPESLLSQQVMMQKSVENSPLYEKKGKAYQSIIKLEKDNIQVNGKKMTVDDLTMLIMQSAM